MHHELHTVGNPFITSSAGAEPSSIQSEPLDDILVHFLRISLDTPTNSGLEAMNTSLKARAAHSTTNVGP